MFKVGDKVVCIDDSPSPMNPKLLHKYEIYNVDRILSEYAISILLDGQKYALNNKRFISLLDYRKNKIHRICSKSEIKLNS